jgi:hypothetical protein
MAKAVVQGQVRDVEFSVVHGASAIFGVTVNPATVNTRAAGPEPAASPSLSEMDTADMKVFLEQMLVICGVLEFNFFQKAAGVAPSTRLLHLQAKGLTATGYEDDGGVVVQAGSLSPKEAAQRPTR